MILDLDKDNYSYALVSGPDTSYLWILSRTPVLDEEIVRKLQAKAETFGFDTGKLMFVEQDGDQETEQDGVGDSARDSDSEMFTGPNS